MLVIEKSIVEKAYNIAYKYQILSTAGYNKFIITKTYFNKLPSTENMQYHFIICILIFGAILVYLFKLGFLSARSRGRSILYFEYQYFCIIIFNDLNC